MYVEKAKKLANMAVKEQAGLGRQFLAQPARKPPKRARANLHAALYLVPAVYTPAMAALVFSQCVHAKRMTCCAALQQDLHSEGSQS